MATRFVVVGFVVVAVGLVAPIDQSYGTIVGIVAQLTKSRYLGFDGAHGFWFPNLSIVARDHRRPRLVVGRTLVVVGHRSRSSP